MVISFESFVIKRHFEMHPAILFSAAPSLRDDENIVGFSLIDQKDLSAYVIRIDELIDEQGHPIELPLQNNSLTSSLKNSSHGRPPGPMRRHLCGWKRA